jgi:hypothetical protein
LAYLELNALDAGLDLEGGGYEQEHVPCMTN